ncbi:MAG: Lrp/AsnC family transcriptional regulator [Pseudomonadota bacterium]
MKRLRYENGPLDPIDGRILAALIDNARVSHAELGRQIGPSAPSVAERIRRLEEAGVIEGYSARIRPSALGLAVAAWIRVKPLPGELKAVEALLAGMPEIVSCDRVTGEDCFLAKAYVPTIADLERLIDTLLPHATTTTAIVQSLPVSSRAPRFDGESTT